jgi:hypothetical protein
MDFRTSKPKKARGMVAFSPGSTNANRLDDLPFLYFIICSDNYTTYEIYDAKLNLVVDEVALLEWLTPHTPQSPWQSTNLWVDEERR